MYTRGASAARLPVGLHVRFVLAFALLAGVVLPATVEAQLRTPTGFYYPTVLQIGLCGGWLERDAAHGGCYPQTGYYHIADDMPAPQGGPVYAISSGSVVSRSLTGWGDGNIGLAVLHTLSNGTKFVALYGHVRSSLQVGDTVAAGATIASIGPYPSSQPHLHFGIVNGTALPTGNLGSLPNSVWPWTNSFVDPLEWITTRSPNTTSVARLTVSVTGSGTVSSVPSGISCPGVCAADFVSGSAVSLAATPAAGWMLSGWGGACSGDSGCAPPMSGSQTVTAVFVQAALAPGSFVKTGPVNRVPRQSPAAVLTWTASVNATSYEYCVDRVNNGVCDTTWTSVGAAKFATPTGLLGNTTYYWQVRAKNATTSVAGDGGIWWEFKTRAASNQFVCDIDWDGRSDLLLQHTTDGLVGALWLQGVTVGGGSIIASPGGDTSWKVVGAGDFNDDNGCDLFWRRDDGTLLVMIMNGKVPATYQLASPSRITDQNAQLRAVVDVNGDNFADLIWQHATTGVVTVWLMNGGQRLAEVPLSPAGEADPTWTIVGAGDVNLDGYPDLVWHHPLDGRINTWLMRGLQRLSSNALSPAAVTDVDWKIKSIGDINWDREPELIWWNQRTGQMYAWFIRNHVAWDMKLLSATLTDTTWVIVGPR